MKIQVGVNQKMKLYNVYRICKQNIKLIENIDINSKETSDLLKDGKIRVYTINNWNNLKMYYINLKKFLF